MPDFSNVQGARENEQLADSLDITQDAHRNWIVIIRFYSFLHYVEERLQADNYDSDRHTERMENIRRCHSVDSYVYNIYRLLYDLSRDARYECIRMGESEVRVSEQKLEEGKSKLGFSHGSDGTHKYSTS